MGEEVIAKIMKRIEVDKKRENFRELIEEYGSSILEGDSIVIAVENVKLRARELEMNITNKDIEEIISCVSLGSKEIGEKCMEIYSSENKRREVPYVQ